MCLESHPEKLCSQTLQMQNYAVLSGCSIEDVRKVKPIRIESIWTVSSLTLKVHLNIGKNSKKMSFTWVARTTDVLFSPLYYIFCSKIFHCSSLFVLACLILCLVTATFDHFYCHSQKLLSTERHSSDPFEFLFQYSFLRWGSRKNFLFVAGQEIINYWTSQEFKNLLLKVGSEKGMLFINENCS